MPKAKGQPTVHGIVVIENGPHQGTRAYFTRDSLRIFGHLMAKADLMQVVAAGDRFEVEIVVRASSSVPAGASSLGPGGSPAQLIVTSISVGTRKEYGEKEGGVFSAWYAANNHNHCAEGN